MERTVGLDLATLKDDEREVSLAFSSEEPVIRSWGIEVLSHEDGAMRTTRTKNGLPLLFNHDRNILLGRLRDIRIGDDRKGRGTARFDDTPTADEKYRQVKAGSLTDVSVGYMVHYVEEAKPQTLSPELLALSARAKLPVYIITDWEPYEASFVTVAADPTVGVGRAAEPEPEAQEVPDLQQPSNTEPKIEEEKMSEQALDVRVVTDNGKNPDEQRKLEASLVRDERARVQAINAIYEKFRNFIPDSYHDKAIEEGMPVQEFQAYVLQRLEEPKPINTPIGELGLSKKEIKRYSITRAILSQWPGHREMGIDPSFELALSAEIQKKTDSDTRRGGIFVPYDVMNAPADPSGTGILREGRRDLTAGVAAAGGYLIGTDHLGGEFIDVLRNSMVLRRLGARVISGLRGNVNIPRRTAGVTTYWLATEGTGPTESSNTFGQLALSPKHIGARLDYTRNLLLQSNPSIDTLVNGDFAIALALGQDRAGFHGSGTAGEPTGIAATSGVGSVTGTSLGYAGMLEFQTDVASANALAASCAYVTTPAVAALLAQRMKATNTYSPLWNGNILETDDVCGFRGFSTNQIDSGTMFFGDFSQVIIGEWGVLELVVDPYTQSANGIIQVTAFQSIDIGVRIPGAFSVATSIT